MIDIKAGRPDNTATSGKEELSFNVLLRQQFLPSGRIITFIVSDL